MSLKPGRKYKANNEIIYSETADFDGDTLLHLISKGFTVTKEYVIIPAGSELDYISNEIAGGNDTFSMNGVEVDLCLEDYSVLTEVKSEPAFAERIKLARAMDTIVRSLNDEEAIDAWLANGVADEDYKLPDEDWEIYVEDDEDFRDLMTLFKRLVAKSDIYCDKVLGNDEKEYR